MKIKMLLLSLLLFMAPALTFAGQEMELEKRIILDQKKLVVMQNMSFTPSEADKFWPVYDKFQEKLFQNRIAKVKLIGVFADSYKELTDKKALEIVDEHYKVQSERDKIMHSFDNELRKILPGKKVFRYLQVENKLETIALFELVKRIPLAKK